MMKLQKFSEGLKEELADEMKLATGHKDSCEICYVAGRKSHVSSAYCLNSLLVWFFGCRYIRKDCFHMDIFVEHGKAFVSVK